MTMPFLMDVCKGEINFLSLVLMPHIDFDRDFLLGFSSFRFVIAKDRSGNSW
jgi:hypothetical protein